MIPKPLYESLPFLLMFFGACVIAVLAGYATPAGLLLYGFGAWIWLVRSDKRRLNERQPRVLGKRIYRAETLYEFEPFLYILIGLLVLGWLQHDVRWVSGPLMIVFGLAVLLMRADSRSRPPATLQLRQVRQKVASKQPAWHRSKNSLQALNDREGAAAKESRAAQCQHCDIETICKSVNLNIHSVQQIMRLSQTVRPNEAFEHYRHAVERVEGRSVSNEELQSVLNLLCGYSDFCATWSKRSSMVQPIKQVG